MDYGVFQKNDKVIVSKKHKPGTAAKAVPLLLIPFLIIIFGD